MQKKSSAKNKHLERVLRDGQDKNLILNKLIVVFDNECGATLQEKHFTEFTVVSEPDEMTYPIEFITESHDETFYGESFSIAYESHYRLVIADP